MNSFLYSAECLLNGKTEYISRIYLHSHLGYYDLNNTLRVLPFAGQSTYYPVK